MATLKIFKDKSLLETVYMVEGANLGRSKNADIVLPCEETSGLHAQISKNAAKQWVLYDKNSKNGIYYLGDRVSEVVLEEDIPVNIGSLEIYFSREAVQQNEATEPWNATLSQWSKKASKNFKNTPTEIKPLVPALELYFLKGLQAESRFLIGYGPRHMGSASYDLPLFEENAPGTACSFLPDPKGVRVFTKHPGKIILNNKSLTSEILNDGDIIKIGNSEIKVTLLDEFSY